MSHSRDIDVDDEGSRNPRILRNCIHRKGKWCSDGSRDFQNFCHYRSHNGTCSEVCCRSGRREISEATQQSFANASPSPSPSPKGSFSFDEEWKLGKHIKLSRRNTKETLPSSNFRRPWYLAKEATDQKPIRIVGLK